MMLTYGWWLNVATLAGIAILAIPVWSLNSRKRRRHLIQNADQSSVSDSAFRKQTRAILLGKHDKQVGDWRRRDEICLFAGYALLLGSAIARVLVPEL